MISKTKVSPYIFILKNLKHFKKYFFPELRGDKTTQISYLSFLTCTYLQFFLLLDKKKLFCNNSIIYTTLAVLLFHTVGSNQFHLVNIGVIRLLSVITTTPFGNYGTSETMFDQKRCEHK